MILSSAEDIDQVLYVLSVYVLHVVGNSNLDICEFLALDEADLEILFCDLASLISVGWSGAPNGKKIKILRFLHASLHDFLRDPIRSKEYFINIETYRTQHIANILRYVPLSE